MAAGEVPSFKAKLHSLSRGAPGTHFPITAAPQPHHVFSACPLAQWTTDTPTS